MQQKTIQGSIQAFKTTDFKNNALEFFKNLGYQSNKTSDLDLIDFLPALDYTKALVNQWQVSYVLFQLADDDLQNSFDIFSSSNVAIDNTIMQSYFFAAVELKGSVYTRSQLVEITRAINKDFVQPILLLFKHGSSLTLSVIHRRLNKKDSDKDVLEKVTLLKDIRIENTHRAHLDILTDFSFENLETQPKNFVELHNAWRKVLDTKELNKQFYGKLFDWYLFALSQVTFPQIRPEEDKIPNEQHQSESLIRLLTRLLFVWFMKEKGLICPELFDKNALTAILKNFTGESCEETIYYKAILQNLFFATLNMPIEKRKVIDKGFNPKEYGNQLVYRYPELFVAEDFERNFANIPFLNGGLFDCLDRKKDKDNSAEIRLDGFSTVKSKQAIVPDKLFFGEYKNIDLSEAYQNKNKSKVTIYGLIDILQQHKFTVEENTPIEEDIALDPELLGRVFENLLASYSEETKTTARKQTGSFYTPREIVDYMVDESLKAYFKSRFETFNDVNLLGDQDLVSLSRQNDLLQRIDELFISNKETVPAFSPTEKSALINAIDNCKILDPACGSGAFPMGILHKLVFILSKLDPKNFLWKERQIDKLKKAIDDTALREKAKQVIEEAFNNNELDYGRKLYLIENCIHGVDIQLIAVQISKLRFFISLIVDQKSDKEKPNLGIRALPNLDFKVVAANTLIGAPNEDFANHGLFASDDFFTNFANLTSDYFKVSEPEDKKSLKTKIEKLIAEKCEEKIKAVQRLSAIGKSKDKKIIEHQQQDIKLWQSYSNLFKHEAVAFFETKYFFPQMNNGFDVVIGNPPYIQIQKFSGQQCQKDWQNQNYETFEKTGDIYALFIEKGISLLKQNGLLTFITSNKWMRAGYGKSLREFLATKTQPLKLIDFGDSQLFENATTYTNILISKNSNENIAFNACSIQDDFTIETPLADYFNTHKKSMPLLSEESWVISSGIEQKIKEKIESKGTSLKNWDVFINTGIKTALNEAFIIDTETKEKLCLEDKKSAEIIKPILRGRDIKRYTAEWAGLWIINSHNNPPVNVNNYPAIKKHLDAFYPQLEKRLDKGVTPYNLRNCAYIDEFEKEKIIWIEMSPSSNFTFDTSNAIVLNTAYILVSKSPKYMLAVLNSKVIDFYFMTVATEVRGATRRYIKQYVEQMPIPEISSEQQQPFIELVDKILELKKTGENTKALEDKIDDMVYDLYGLTPEEIKIVEGKK